MPVPKRKTSKSRRDMRQACKFIRPKIFSICTNCSGPVSSHIACPTCGFYKGKQVVASKFDRAIKRNEIRMAQAQKQGSVEGAAEGQEAK